MTTKIAAPFLRTPYNYDRNQVSDETGLKCLDKSLAQQQFTEECDINTIVERFHLTGEVPQLTELPSYGDFTGIFNYQTAMNAIVAARETFMTLPAKLRSRFNNDPEKFLEFCDDPENLPEARKLGLLKEPATPLPGTPAETPHEPPAQPNETKKGGTTPKPPKPAPKEEPDT